MSTPPARPRPQRRKSSPEIGPVTIVAVNDEEMALAEAAAELDAVQAVLGRLDDGTVDRCEVCGGPIGIDRLRTEPLTQRCERH